MSKVEVKMKYGWWQDYWWWISAFRLSNSFIWSYKKTDVTLQADWQNGHTVGGTAQEGCVPTVLECSRGLLLLNSAPVRVWLMTDWRSDDTEAAAPLSNSQNDFRHVNQLMLMMIFSPQWKGLNLPDADLLSQSWVTWLRLSVRTTWGGLTIKLFRRPSLIWISHSVQFSPVTIWKAFLGC